MKIVFTEEIELTDKEVYILTEIERIGGTAHYGRDEHNYLHSTFNPPIGYESDEIKARYESVKGNDIAYWNLIKLKLLYKSDSGSEYEYIRYSISERGKFVLNAIKAQTTNI